MSFVKRHYEEIVVVVIGYIAVTLTSVQMQQSAGNEIHRSLLEKVQHNEIEISELWNYHRRPNRGPEDKYEFPKEIIKPDQRLFRKKE